MDPELKRLLEETNALAKDNHRMLRAIRRDQWIGFIAKVVFWIIVLALPLYLYQQYITPFIERFNATQSPTSTSPFWTPSSVELQKLLNSYKAGQ